MKKKAAYLSGWFLTGISAGILILMAACTSTPISTSSPASTPPTALTTPTLAPAPTPAVNNIPSGITATISGAPYQSNVIPVQGQQNTGIWVAGQGEVFATPDNASISLGVEAQALTVAEAQTNANNAMNAVAQALKAKGISDQDITTTVFSITPVMDYKTNTITGYRVSNQVTVKVRNIADTGQIIDAVSAAGGNFIQVNSISFTVSDPVPYQSQARAKAMADAAAKANQLATLAGVKLGTPTYISETSTSYVPFPIAYSAGGAVPAPAPTTSINPGQTQISVTVQVVYEIQ